LYGFYTTHIASTFFPLGNEYLSLAPLLVLTRHLLQGFLASVELGGCRSTWSKWCRRTAGVSM